MKSANEPELLAERDDLMGKALHEADGKARKALQDRVDEIQAELGQDPIYGTPKGKGKK